MPHPGGDRSFAECRGAGGADPVSVPADWKGHPWCLASPFPVALVGTFPVREAAGFSHINQLNPCCGLVLATGPGGGWTRSPLIEDTSTRAQGIDRPWRPP